MMHHLVFPVTLPSLNEYQYACRSHFSKGADMKRQWVTVISAYILQQFKEGTIPNRVSIDFVWYEPNKKRDLDNITGFGKKVIQDALVKCKVIENDGWKQIAGFSDRFYIDKQNPRIEIFIKEDVTNQNEKTKGE